MDKRSNRDNEDLPNTTHYIAKQNTVLSRISGKCDVNVSDLRSGMLVEAVEILRDGGLQVRVNDPSGSDVWQKTEWLCHRYDLIPISLNMWQYLAAVPASQDRVQLATNKQLWKELKDIRLNSTVWYFPDTSATDTVQAIVKFIGPVPELGPGFYFGLDLLDNRYLCKDFQLTQQYFKCSQANGAFATLSNIVFKLESFAAGGAKQSEKENSEVSSTKGLAFTRSEDTLYKKSEPVPSSSGNFYGKEPKAIIQDTSALPKYHFSVSEDNKNNNDGGINAILEHPWTYKCTQQLSENLPISNEASTLDCNTKDYIFCKTDAASQNEEFANSMKIENSGALNFGSTVEVHLGSETHYGVVRWIGPLLGGDPNKLIAGVELDMEHPVGTDGTSNGVRYFHCASQRAVFVDIEQCHYKNRIPDDRTWQPNSEGFGNMESAVVAGMVRPICVKGDLKSICGKYRGIQGHHNSCYLDATLFSMFTFTNVFDNLLFRPPNEKDCAEYEEVQRVLREEIVNPLRKNLFVRADRVMKLRTLLEQLSSVSGLTSEEKDPEEFLTSLVAQILNAEPFLKLSSGQEAYHYQLFVEKDDHLNLPTVQQLLEQSFLASNVRLKEVPSCLIIQMPRFGKSFKMYQKIQPSQLLDVTDIIEDSPRQCTVCGKLAEFECRECYGECGIGLESIAFCLQCLEKAHRHERRSSHKPKKLTVPMEFAILQEHCPVPRLYMELSAVVCIETSHYVSFVKCGSGSEAPWCFFDSMADRKGEQNGYNIPEMVPCPDFPYWLSEEGAKYLTELTDDRQLPEHAKRLLCDAYMCMYQSPDVMMYR